MAASLEALSKEIQKIVRRSTTQRFERQIAYMLQKLYPVVDRSCDRGLDKKHIIHEYLTNDQSYSKQGDFGIARGRRLASCAQIIKGTKIARQLTVGSIKPPLSAPKKSAVRPLRNRGIFNITFPSLVAVDLHPL
jgi:hypothetical protein